MPTQISCGLTDCENNSGGGQGANPQCQAQMVRIAPGKMGGAICFQYTGAPQGQQAMVRQAGQQQSMQQGPMSGNVDKALY